MASLTDLFNPTFLMFLGILLLVVALLVVYFESKIREQNHKIASMLSLVSTLAEDMNTMKMGLNHLVMAKGFQEPNILLRENLGNNQIIPNKVLIEVSDDEDDEDDEDSDDEDIEDSDDEDSDDENDNESKNESESESDDEDQNDEEDQNDVKVIKIKVSNEDISSFNKTNNLDLEPAEDLDEFENDELPEINEQYIEQVLDLKYDNSLEEKSLEESSTNDLKTINIHLGNEHHNSDETIDFKKLQLPKLRSIVVEKGLTTNSEASKLKKPELLKLLGTE
jgi:hypothetical protein